MGLILANPARHERKSSIPTSWDAPALLRLWHLASLDAPTVAVTWAWAFAWASHVHLPAWILLSLGLVVWAIYIGDRLLDARRFQQNGKGQPLQERHYFHWRHRRILLSLAAASAATALWLVGAHMTRIAMGQDSVVAAAAMAYFSGVHTRRGAPGLATRIAKRIVSREFVVGAIFSAGCILPVVTIAATGHQVRPVAAFLIPAGLFFAFLAWLNVRAIGDWESFSLSNQVQKIAWILAVCGIVLAIGLIPLSPRIAALSLSGVASTLLLALLDRSRRRFTQLALRIAADAVLLIPLLLVFQRIIS
ncbi:MAG: hypothetical protein ACLGSD_11250 [Acidobacteriota bacterium]